MSKSVDLEIGDIVCDMHDVTLRVGEAIYLAKEDAVFQITKFIQIRTGQASEMINSLCYPAKVTNKEAVVVGATHNYKGYQCAYCYDGDKFGLFEIEPV